MLLFDQSGDDLRHCFSAHMIEQEENQRKYF